MDLKSGNDDVMTPPWLCDLIVSHFCPRGRCLEPCAGTGNFIHSMLRHGVDSVDACELKEGRPFHDYQGHVDWIITNPPWSKISEFLRKAMRVSREVVFLMTINHAWTTSRMRDVDEAGFHLNEIFVVPWPDEFPRSGFVLGAVRWSKGKGNGSIKLA